MKEETAEEVDSSLVPRPSSLPRRRRVSSICTDFEDEARGKGFRLIAGVDEVGRGALAGPVVAAAVILDPTRPFPEGLDDSKKLTAKQRERIADEVLQTAVAYAVGQVEPRLHQQRAGRPARRVRRYGLRLRRRERVAGRERHPFSIADGCRGSP